MIGNVDAGGDPVNVNDLIRFAATVLRLNQPSLRVKAYIFSAVLNTFSGVTDVSGAKIDAG